MNNAPRSVIDRAVGACLSVLVGAVALYVAVRLVEAVATALLIILAVVGFVAVTIALLRSRGRGW